MKSLSKSIFALSLILSLSSPVAALPETAVPNRLTSMVYQWFSLFDTNAPVEKFLPYLDDGRLLMRFPEATLRNEAEFRAWYQGVLKTFRRASHTLNKVTLSPAGEGHWQAEIDVLWQAETFDGEVVRFRARQKWLLRQQGESFTILEYDVSRALSNKVKEKLLRSEPVFGGFVTIPSPKVVENLALAGKLDFVWIEGEHSEFGPEAVQMLTLAAENEKLVPIGRVPKNDPELIKPYLGTGIQGLIVPSIRSAAEARQAVAAALYPPLGNRPAGAERANRYLGRFAETLAVANDEMLVVLMIETRQAVEQIDEIAAIRGVDVLHLGPYDLALSLGVKPGSPELAAAIAKVEAAARKAGIPLGCAAPSMAFAQAQISKGYRFFTIPGDMELLQQGTAAYFKP